LSFIVIGSLRVIKVVPAAGSVPHLCVCSLCEDIDDELLDCRVVHDSSDLEAFMELVGDLDVHIHHRTTSAALDERRERIEQRELLE
jgi:hypothetical protein